MPVGRQAGLRALFVGKRVLGNARTKPGPAGGLREGARAPAEAEGAEGGGLHTGPAPPPAGPEHSHLLSCWVSASAVGSPGCHGSPLAPQTPVGEWNGVKLESRAQIPREGRKEH